MTEGELGRVKGVTSQVRARLSDVVTVLPTSSTLINVNTAPPEVLSALFPNVDQKLLEQFLTTRGETPARGKQRIQYPPCAAPEFDHLPDDHCPE